MGSVKSNLKQSHSYLGMNKSGSDASLCWIREDAAGELIREIYLKERFTRVKGASGQIGLLLQQILPELPSSSDLLIGESSYFHRPVIYEKRLNQRSPFFQAIQKRGLTRFSSTLNPAIQFVPHHLSHAVAATSVSPFRKSLIVVMDGGGNHVDSFDTEHPEVSKFPCPWLEGPRPEVCTVYLQDGPNLECVHKEWQLLSRFEPIPGGAIGTGLGTFYDSIAYYIFQSRRESGKVMGLAPFGRPQKVNNRVQFIQGLDWTRAFPGGGKKKWEASPFQKVYRDLAATAQVHFEESLLWLLEDLKNEFPKISNLILTGGCALNCVANAKVAESGLFKNVYVPPFPSDESISLGVAEHLRSHQPTYSWKTVSWDKQRSNFGPASSVPKSSDIRKVFPEAKFLLGRALTKEVARRLGQGQVVAWFQGQSESGPRALGYRSLLANPMKAQMKDHLNQQIKGRENFRPFGCSVLWESAATYFEVPNGFNGPFMSFAVPVRKQFQKKLKAVVHVDGTSRIQTVRQKENPFFHQLIHEFGKISGFPGVLNTSMNVMGEPLVETLQDAKRFLDNVKVDCLVIGTALIEKRPS